MARMRRSASGSNRRCASSAMPFGPLDVALSIDFSSRTAWKTGENGAEEGFFRPGDVMRCPCSGANCRLRSCRSWRET